MRALIVLALLTPVLSAAPIPKEKEKPKDEELIVGTWRLVDVDVGGGQKMVLPDDWKKIEYKFGEKGVFAMEQPGRPAMEGTFKLDPTAKVKAIDLLRKDQSPQSLGLYELDGDTLKLCVTQKPGADRPAELKGDAKAFTALFTLARVKDEKKDK